jgi:hypothetical protein
MMMTERIAPGWKIDWLSAIAGALIGCIVTWVVVTTWIANKVVETGSQNTAAQTQSCILKITPLMANEIKAKEWCDIPANRTGM